MKASRPHARLVAENPLKAVFQARRGAVVGYGTKAQLRACEQPRMIPFRGCSVCAYAATELGLRTTSRPAAVAGQANQLALCVAQLRLPLLRGLRAWSLVLAIPFG